MKRPAGAAAIMQTVDRDMLLKMAPSSLLNAHIDDPTSGTYGSTPTPPEGESSEDAHLGKKGRR